jgi:CheY-like chemotaxis protein
MQTASRTHSAFSECDSPQPLRVMVVEDSLDAAQAMAVHLRVWGHECCLCTSGNEALSLMSIYQPNVVLIDIGLPDMDGWELAERLPTDTLLIAVTARGEQSDFQRSRLAGIHYHLVKPAFHKQLRDLLERFSRSV